MEDDANKCFLYFWNFSSSKFQRCVVFSNSSRVSVYIGLGWVPSKSWGLKDFGHARSEGAVRYDFRFNSCNKNSVLYVGVPPRSRTFTHPPFCRWPRGHFSLPFSYFHVKNGGMTSPLLLGHCFGGVGTDLSLWISPRGPLELRQGPSSEFRWKAFASRCAASLSLFRCDHGIFGDPIFATKVMPPSRWLYMEL